MTEAVTESEASPDRLRLRMHSQLRSGAVVRLLPAKEMKCRPNLLRRAQSGQQPPVEADVPRDLPGEDKEDRDDQQDWIHQLRTAHDGKIVAYPACLY